MLAGRGKPCKPAWESDQLDSPRPPEIEPAYFDEALDAWVLSRHMDVLAAFHSSNLAPIGPNNKETSAPPTEGSRLKKRIETLESLSPRQLRVWREKLEPEVDALVTSLPSEQPVDLIGEYARPLCLTLASMVTCIPMQDAANLRDRAQEVSAASAEPYDAALRSRAKSASAELRECFHSGPERCAIRDSLRSRKPCLAYWEMHGSLCHSTPKNGSRCTDNPTLRSAGSRGFCVTPAFPGCS